MKKVVLTGGHLTPALALIEELETAGGIKLLFFGRKYATEGVKTISTEYKVIQKQKIKFYTITAGRLQRKFTKYTLSSLLKLPIGFLQSFLYLLLVRPLLIVSFGGYLSVPVVISGWLLGIDSVTHEQATIPGLANKINSLFVKKIFISWKQTAVFFDSRKTEVIGNLTRKSMYKLKPESKIFTNYLKRSKNLILVLGGSQGSHVLNTLTFDLIKHLPNFYFLHQVGVTNWNGDLDKAKKIKSQRYLATDYIGSEDFARVLKKTQIVISRAGANTIWDLATFKKPSILIPLPISASGEQMANAKVLEKEGFAKIITQGELTSKKVQEAVYEIQKNSKTLLEKASRFQKTLPRDATIKMAKYLVNLLDNG